MAARNSAPAGKPAGDQQIATSLAPPPKAEATSLGADQVNSLAHIADPGSHDPQIASAINAFKASSKEGLSGRTDFSKNLQNAGSKAAALMKSARVAEEAEQLRSTTPQEADQIAEQNENARNILEGAPGSGEADGPAPGAGASSPSTDDTSLDAQIAAMEAAGNEARAPSPKPATTAEATLLEKLVDRLTARDAASLAPSSPPTSPALPSVSASDIDLDSLTENERFLYDQNVSLLEKLKGVSSFQSEIQAARQEISKQQGQANLNAEIAASLAKFPDVFDDSYFGRVAAKNVADTVLYDSDDPVALIAMRVARDVRKAKAANKADYVKRKINKGAKVAPASGASPKTQARGDDGKFSSRDLTRDGGRVTRTAALRMFRQARGG